jgi:xylulokinase
MLSLGNGGSSLTWALGLLGLGQESGERLDAVLASVAAGSEGVRFWPFLAPFNAAGVAPGTAGRLAGLRLCHTSAHIARSVVEGLALELTRHLRFLTDAGIRVGRLVMCGGAAASQVTPSIIADATGLPVACSTESEMSAVGAAVVARGLLEPDAALADLSRAMSPAVRVVRPGANVGLYRGMLDEYLASLPAAPAQGESP